MMDLARISIVLLLSTALAFACRPGDARDQQLLTRVELVGMYSDVQQSDEEHESGYTLELWRDRDGLFGTFMVHGPQIGDPARGLLSDVKYDQRTGQLHFTAKLSIYPGYPMKDRNGQMKEVPASHDLVTFDGRLDPGRLTGSLTVQSTRGEEKLEGTRKEELNLKHHSKTDEGLYPLDLRPNTCAAWLDEMGPILKRSGPTW